MTAARLDPPVDGDPSPTVAVLPLDLDGFKSGNDRFGQEVGDELLTVVGRRLAAVARDGEVVDRFGGDEATVLLGHVAGAVGARAVAERLLAGLKDPVTLERGETVRVGVSARVALGLWRQTNLSALLRDADAALYRAKVAGRGGIGVFKSRVVSRETCVVSPEETASSPVALSSHDS